MYLEVYCFNLPQNLAKTPQKSTKPRKTPSHKNLGYRTLLEPMYVRPTYLCVCLLLLGRKFGMTSSSNLQPIRLKVCPLYSYLLRAISEVDYAPNKPLLHPISGLSLIGGKVKSSLETHYNCYVNARTYNSNADCLQYNQAAEQ